MKDCWSSTGKKTGGKGKGNKHTKAMRAKDLEVPRVYFGLCTLLTVRNVENLVTAHKTAEAPQLLAGVGLVKRAGPGTRNRGDEQQPVPETGSTIGGLWLCSLGGPANASNPHLRTVRFGVDSGAEETAIATIPESVARRAPCEIAQEDQVEDMSDTYLVLKGPLSVAALVDTGHQVTSVKDQSYVWHPRSRRWQHPQGP